MKTYPVGVDIAVTIPFIDLNGDPVTPTGLSVRVLDEDGNQVMPPTSVTLTPGETDLTHTIGSAYNSLATGVIKGLRVVELSMTTSGGVIPSVVMYMIQRNSNLVILDDSFQTYEQALVLASQMPALIGWDGATESERKNALAEAFRRLTTIGYRIRRPEDVDTQNTIPDTDEVIQPRYWPIMTLERWGLLSDRFKIAIKKAQIAEANEILRGDIVGDKRRSGLLSETIGESSMMFRSGKPLDLGISASALSYVTGYVETRITITRS